MILNNIALRHIIVCVILLIYLYSISNVFMWLFRYWRLQVTIICKITMEYASNFSILIRSSAFFISVIDDALTQKVNSVSSSNTFALRQQRASDDILIPCFDGIILWLPQGFLFLAMLRPCLIADTNKIEGTNLGYYWVHNFISVVYRKHFDQHMYLQGLVGIVQLCICLCSYNSKYTISSCCLNLVWCQAYYAVHDVFELVQH